MNLRRWLVVAMVGAAWAVAGACAKGNSAGDDDDDGAGGTTAGTTTGGTGGTSTGTGTGLECDPPEHRCGNICAGNTPATGCYHSTTCEACPSVQNGVAICTEDGFCVAQCTEPYVLNEDVCECPFECCGTAECNGNPCVDHECVEPCAVPLCGVTCFMQGCGHFCEGTNCQCINCTGTGGAAGAGGTGGAGGAGGAAGSAGAGGS